MFKNGSRQRGGKAYRQHQSLKKYVRERDNYTCQRCGATLAANVQLDVDHIVPFHVSHDSLLSNLRVLCHSCNLTGRRYTLPKGKMQQIPYEDYEDYIKRELANCANH